MIWVVDVVFAVGWAAADRDPWRAGVGLALFAGARGDDTREGADRPQLGVPIKHESRARTGDWWSTPARAPSDLLRRPHRRTRNGHRLGLGVAVRRRDCQRVPCLRRARAPFVGSWGGRLQRRILGPAFVPPESHAGCGGRSRPHMLDERTLPDRAGCRNGTEPNRSRRV